MHKYTLTFLQILLITCSLQAQQVRPFKNGDRVVFMGNSITDGGHYHSYIWLYYLTRFPQMRISVFNAGIGGDVSGQMFDRLEEEVFAKKPTLMTLTFGMNDTGYQFVPGAKADSVYNEKIALSLANFTKIEAALLRHPEITKVMIASSPYDETAKIKARALVGKNKAMLKIANAQQQAAAKHGWSFVDFNRPMTIINRLQQQRDSAYTMEGADRIHPTNDGHMVMAYLFLKAQGLAGKKVAAVNINVPTLGTTTDNCKISMLRGNIKDMAFNYLAGSLPYPVDTIGRGANSPTRSQADGLKLVPFTQEFNQELLTVKGLPSGKNYELLIDGKMIGNWSAEAFAQGINLATCVNTPQYQQALALMHINEERWELERRLREYYWLQYQVLKPKGLLHNDGLATVDSLKKYARKDFFVAVTLPTYQRARFKAVRDTWQQEIDLLTSQMYVINQPVTHHFEIKIAS